MRETSAVFPVVDSPPPAPTPGSPDKAAVRSMFDRIAPRYDFLNHLLSAGIDTRWRKRAVELLELPGPARILDLCTGTADLLIEALGRHPGHFGVGADLSGQMLVRAAGKLERRGLTSRSGLVGGDGERLPLADRSFDGALVSFGIRNMGDPPAALRELRRILRPGGRLVVLEFSTPGGALGALYRVYFHRILPRIGGLVSGDRSAYSYLPASVARFPGPREFAALLEGTGFRSVVVRPLSGGIAHLYRGEV
ncbi:MAG TPA: ubiquinone/menaquinone biosynthesis methyltransferase [Vicinamibacteria bacterium]|nr:ubiquinone/menaquinone biosynthesis methyltransferase [Vicinamibacteria bacterium]